ncbi:MAG TPA: glycosyltransferase family 4 protein [Gaiellaceae bacterium]|nr:glycosyltransferase family 4 protein [Gaiellaceae bacterium]
MTARPRLLLVARTRYELPLSPSLERKFAALRERFDVRVLATAADGRARDDGTFRLVGRLPLADGPLFYALLPLRVRRLARERPPAAIVTQSPYEAACVRLAGAGAPVVVELHGDWRTATRLYGSPLRRALSPLADRVGAFGLRRADAVRTISSYTSGLVRALGVEPAAEFPAFMDLELFAGRPPAPLPAEPAALFVGVLELYKNVDGLARAWRLAAPRLPGARLRIVGRGSRPDVVRGLLHDLPEQTAWSERLTQAEVARALDEATCLVLPSRSEGLGRVLIEASLRGRAAVAMDVGGIGDVVADGVNGLLVSSEEELADALVRMLSDRPLAERLGAAARERAGRWLATPEEYADRIAELVARVAPPYTAPG